jgi:EPS-associated MarR family transcriptional regulator
LGYPKGGSVPESSLDIEIRFRLLRVLARHPRASQRELAHELNLSLGKTHYCLRALIERGWVEAGDLRAGGGTQRYTYRPTPSGLAEKARIAHRFLQRTVAEYEALAEEIETLRREIDAGVR